MKPKVSVITSVLNSADTVADTIESVLSQTYPNIEHIVCDGGSTDATLSVVDKYRRKYPEQIIVSSLKDHGIYQGMNRGIKLSSGDFIGFLNADDFFANSTILERLIDVLIKEDIDAVYGDVRYVSRRNILNSRRYYSSENFTPKKMLRGLMPAFPSFYCKRELYKRFGYYDTEFRLAADFDMMLRMIYLGKISTKYLPLECVVMRMGGASNATPSSFSTILREHLRSYKKHNIPTGFFNDISRYASKLLEFLSDYPENKRN